MKSIAFATCNKLPHLSDDDQLVIKHLERRGIRVWPLVWDSGAGQAENADAIIIRSCWDYHLKAHHFRAWIDAALDEGLVLWNPTPVIRWNMEKTYLRDLEERGIAVPPTVWLAQGASASLPDILGERGWGKAVIKPTISATAFQTCITSHATAQGDQGALNEILKSSGAMIQPFVMEVQSRGEWSFIFFSKHYSHAVLKRAKDGDFRVQSDFGGYLDGALPGIDMIEQAQKIIDAIDEPLLYARVDGIEVDGTLMLMELELIEPQLFLGRDELAPQRFAEAISSIA